MRVQAPSAVLSLWPALLPCGAGLSGPLTRCLPPVTIRDTVSDRVTIEEAATRLGVSARTVYRRIAAGDLRTAEEGGRQWVLLEANAGPVGLPGVERMKYAADRAMFDTVSDSDRQMSDTVSQVSDAVSLDLLTMIANLEAERDHLRGANDKLTDTVSKLADNVSELNRTLQGQTIRLAQLEGRVLSSEAAAPAETPRETPQAPPDTYAPPPLMRGLRGFYRAWRGR